jgi:hypothetical protein
MGHCSSFLMIDMKAATEGSKEPGTEREWEDIGEGRSYGKEVKHSFEFDTGILSRAEQVYHTFCVQGKLGNLQDS